MEPSKSSPAHPFANTMTTRFNVLIDTWFGQLWRDYNVERTTLERHVFRVESDDEGVDATRYSPTVLLQIAKVQCVSLQPLRHVFALSLFRSLFQSLFQPPFNYGDLRRCTFQAPEALDPEARSL